MSHTQPISPDPRHWSRGAITSLVLAIMGFATLWIIVGLFLSAAAVVVGHVARHETRSGEFKGRGLATFGVGMGYFSMLTFPILILLISAFFPALALWNSEKAEDQRRASQVQASRLYVACEAYSRANSNRYPMEWKQLSGQFIAGPELAEILRSPYEGGKKVAFEIVAHDRPVLDAIADSVIVIQEIAPPDQKQIAVVYADGHVRSIHNPDSP